MGTFKNTFVKGDARRLLCNSPGHNFKPHSMKFGIFISYSLAPSSNPTSLTPTAIVFFHLFLLNVLRINVSLSYTSYKLDYCRKHIS